MEKKRQKGEAKKSVIKKNHKVFLSATYNNKKLNSFIKNYSIPDCNDQLRRTINQEKFFP